MVCTGGGGGGMGPGRYTRVGCGRGGGSLRLMGVGVGLGSGSDSPSPRKDQKELEEDLAGKTRRVSGCGGVRVRSCDLMFTCVRSCRRGFPCGCD